MVIRTLQPSLSDVRRSLNDVQRTGWPASADAMDMRRKRETNGLRMGWLLEERVV
jgi:hypothetical protein